MLTGARPSGEFPVRALAYEDAAIGAKPLWDAEVRMGVTGAHLSCR